MDGPLFLQLFNWYNYVPTYRGGKAWEDPVFSDAGQQTEWVDIKGIPTDMVPLSKLSPILGPWSQ